MFDRQALRAYFVTGVQDFHDEDFVRRDRAWWMGDSNMMKLLRGKITRKPIRRTDHSSIMRAVPEVLRDAVDLLLEIDGFGTLVKAASVSLLGRGLISVDIYSQRPDCREDHPWIVWVLSAAMVTHLGLSRTFQHLGPNPSFVGSGAGPVNWALFTAIFVGDIATVRRLLELEPRLEHRSKNVTNLLQMAARTGSEEALLLLLEQGADVNSVGDVDATAQRCTYYAWSQGTTLEVACLAGHKHIVDILFDPKHQLKTSGTAYITAVRNAGSSVPPHFRPPWEYDSRSHLDILRVLLDRGEFDDHFREVKYKMLCDACSWGHENVVRLLLEIGIHHLHPSWEWLGWAYRDAIDDGCTEIVRTLIEFDLNQQLCEHPETRLQVHKSQFLFTATEKGYEEIVRVLYDCGVCTFRGRDRMPDAFVLAAEEGHLHLIKFFISTGLDIQTAQCGAHALGGAATKGHETVVQFLLDLQVSTLELPFNEQPMRFAITGGHNAVVDKLKEFGGLTHLTSG